MNKDFLHINFREKILWYSIFFSLFIVATTELLSFFDSINRLWVIFLWALFLIFIFYKLLNKKNLFFLIDILKIKKNNLIFIFIIFLILISTLIICIIYPPTTPDSMSYHLPRVMNWIQYGNLNFFATSDTRQLIMPPFSEYLLLHLQLVSNNDSLSNFPQWFAMFLSLVGISLIIKEFKGSTRTQLVGVLFAITLPMGILQSTSTQTDYITSFWLVVTVYFIIKLINTHSKKYIIAFSLSLALGILTKQTMYLFAFPFCVWLFINFFTIKRSYLKKIILTPLIIILLVNFGHFYRTANLFGNPIGIHTDNVRATSESFSPKYLASNIIRNVSLNLTLPNKSLNENLRKIIKKSHNILNISIDDPINTFGKFYVYFNLYESHAPNTIHFLLIIFLLIISSFIKLNNNLYKFLFAITVGFFLFSLLLKWTPTGNRLILPLFVISSVFFAISLETLKNIFFKNLIILILFLWSLPYIFFNHTRPLAGTLFIDNSNLQINKPYFLSLNETNLYFIQNLPLYEPYIIMINKLAEINCSNISIVGTLYDYEYPLWILLKNKSSNKKIQLNHINVQNISAILQKTHITKNSCAVFHFTANNLGPSLNLKNTEEFRGKFKNEIKLNGISLYY